MINLVMEIWALFFKSCHIKARNLLHRYPNMSVVYPRSGPLALPPLDPNYGLKYLFQEANVSKSFRGFKTVNTASSIAYQNFHHGRPGVSSAAVSWASAASTSLASKTSEVPASAISSASVSNAFPASGSPSAQV